MDKPVALVTGASSGIGAAVAEVLADAGMTVHAMARRADRLETLGAQTGCETHMLDVTDTAGLENLIPHINPDILVLNAGRGAGFEGITETTPEDLAATIDTNITAVLNMIRLSVPAMRARGAGHIVLLGSVSGLYPSVSALYGGTKAAIWMIAQNLRLELRGTGIRVTDIRPGRVATEFYDAAMTTPEKAARAKDTGISELMPSDIAAAVLYAVRAPRHVNVSAIELQPVEQTYGGVNFDPLPDM